MNKYIIIFFLIASALNINAQEIKNEYIITLKRGQTERFMKQMKATQRSTSSRILSKDLNIVEVTTFSESDKYFEEELDDNPLVQGWGYNMTTHKRAIPDDEYFDQQISLQLIEAAEAWDITKGGNDIYDREIVIAVLDDGFDFSHPELEDRIYFNTQEIPDNGIDDDANGYVDDYVGWNGQEQDDSHPFTDNHGIAVAGIIGAKTDNESGVSGINWNIKIMPISGIGQVSDVIASYQYVLDARRLYNESNGTKGAYVVATNYSAGINNAFPTTPSLISWCDMYDAMGEQGVLSAGATTNANTNVDEEGDIPTTCDSPYLISVTNVDTDDTKVSNAGFGAENIDIGAPGRGTFALGEDSGYDQSFGGTSAATPHVAGTIALLYSAPCKSIADMAFTNPGQAALDIRDAIFAGVDPNTTLEGITSTGGRLNIYNSLEKLQLVCDELQLPSIKGPLEIVKIAQNRSTNIEISYITPDETEYNMLITDRMGRTIRHESFVPPTTGRKVMNIDVSDLAVGIYFITIYNDNNINTQKLFLNQE